MPPALPADYLRGPQGQVLPVAPSDAIALPPGLSGDWSLFVSGMVPSSIELPGSGQVIAHPLSVAGSPIPQQQSVIQGVVSPPQAGIVVQYTSRGRHVFVGTTTQADGSFAFTVPIVGPESGLLVARDRATTPRLGLANVTLTPNATEDVQPVALVSPGPAATSLPLLPSGWHNSASLLEVAMSDAQGPWRATVLAVNSPSLPTYPLPSYLLVNDYFAASGDNMAGGETSGIPGQVPDFLPAPQLAGLPSSIAAGSPLNWPPVPSASLYTLQLTPQQQLTTPVWEGATVKPSLTVPQDLVPGASTLDLELDAWDAPGVDIYSVASLPSLPRALIVPEGPPGTSGRHSWNRMAIAWQ